MKTTKRITLSAAAVALSVVILLMSSFLGLMELTVGALASLLVVFIFIEVKGSYPYLVWLATSTLSILLLPTKEIGVAYLVIFGIYPILKAYIERLPRAVWVTVKLLYFALVIGVFIFLFELVSGVSFFSELDGVSAGLIKWAKLGVIALFIFALFVYDMFVTVMIRLYFLKFREKFKRLLK